jgi:sulfane dehydrogenase subunit SoxC
VTDPHPSPGRVIKAPENFLDPAGIRTVHGQAKAGRRDFIRNAFASAVAGAGPWPAPAALAQGNPVPPEGGDPHILNLPAHSTGLGQGVATDGYGKPSQVRGQRAAPAKPGPDADTAVRRCRSRRCRACSASSRPAACTSSATTRAGGTSTRPSTG